MQYRTFGRTSWQVSEIAFRRVADGGDPPASVGHDYRHDPEQVEQFRNQ